MITYREQTHVTHEVESIQCDRCEKIFTERLDTQEFQHISFQGGYASPFGDLINVECDLCASCLLELIEDHMRVVQEPKNPQPILTLKGLANCWGINSEKPKYVKFNPTDAVDFFQREADLVKDLFDWSEREKDQIGFLWGAKVMLDRGLPRGRVLMVFIEDGSDWQKMRSLTFTPNPIVIHTDDPKKDIQSALHIPSS